MHHLIRQTAERTLRETMERRAREVESGFQSMHTDEPNPTGDTGREATVEPLPPCDIAILFANSIEAGGAIDRLKNVIHTRCPGFDEQRGQWCGQNVVLAQCGTGSSRITQAASDLIDFHRPKWLISAGFAAALNANLSRDSIVLADEVVNEQGEVISTGIGKAAESPGLHFGKLVTTEQWLRSQSDRVACREKSVAIAADHESFHVAEVCRDRNVKLMAIRLISDALDDEWDPMLVQLEKQDTIAGKLGAAAGTLLRRPTAIKELFKLKQQAMRSSDQLAAFLESVIPRLTESA